MKIALREHEAEWLLPAPLWGENESARANLHAPALVRLDGDGFMDDFARILRNPHAGSALWAARPSAPDATKGGTKAAGVLYQPLHGCYALVCASLTCRAAGRPEKAVAPARGESVGFVLRRSEKGGAEFAWVPAASGAGSWQLADGATLVEGEELIPLFPVPAPGLIPRRIWAGLVPTSSRETYDGGAGTALPKFDLNLAQKYVIRCVYRRTDCPTVASDPSEAFAVAPVHDPDAPARTIRIPMPIDTSVAGLQKLKKNVGFVLSASLNAQVESLTGKKLKEIDEGNVSAGGSGFTEICTFALPIITLCAMIVMFIFLALLNIVFFWLPFLKICLPIPKEKAS